MRAAEFEESEYEGPLYNQLERGSHILWNPGQVLEGCIGFDRAFMVHNLEVWRSIGLSRVPRGALLARYKWPIGWGPPQPKRRFPDFRLNLFLQAKRSFFSSRPPRVAARIGKFRGKTWAFFIDEHQQLLLEVLADKTRKRAHVAYAAPVFHRLNDLWRHTRQKTIVANSSFPTALRLREHKAWYYQKVGATGIANPEPESVEEPSLLERLRLLISETESSADTGEFQLESLSERILEVLGDERLPESFQRARFFDELDEINRLSEQFNLPPTARAYLQVSLFADSFAMIWLVVSVDAEKKTKEPF